MKSKQIKLAAIMLIGAALTMLGGCLNPVSLDDYGYVVSIGVDSGTTKKYYVTLALQRASLTQGNEKDGGAILLAAEGDSLVQAIDVIESNVSNALNFTRTNFIMFSREVAQRGDIEDFLSFSFDEIKMRKSALVVITDQTVHEFFGGLSANNSANITKLQASLLRDQKDTGTIIMTNVSGFFEACVEGRFDVCAPLGFYDADIITDMQQKTLEAEGKDPLSDIETGDRVGGLKSATAGVALFDGWTMTGELNGEETQFLNIIKGDYENGDFVLVADDGSQVVILAKLETYSRNVRSDTIYSDDICVDVKIVLTISVLQYNGEMSYDELSEWVSKETIQYMTENLDYVLNKCKECQCDAAMFGTTISKCFSSVDSWQNYDWKARYQNLSPQYDIEIIVTDKMRD